MSRNKKNKKQTFFKRRLLWGKVKTFFWNVIQLGVISYIFGQVVVASFNLFVVDRYKKMSSFDSFVVDSSVSLEAIAEDTMRDCLSKNYNEVQNLLPR